MKGKKEKWENEEKPRKLLIKEEKNLCKQVAEKHRKEIKYGDWFLRNDMKFEYTLFLRVGKNLITGYIQGEICFMDDMSNVDIKKAIPLWTISDCLEFLKMNFEALSWLHGNKIFEVELSSSTFCITHYRGKTPLETCLKAVLAVIEDSK